MFANIHIERFRGISEADVKDFRRVNLFWGENNCGKSSLLEAIFLLSGFSNAGLPLTVNRIRQYYKTSKDDLALEFYGFDKDIPIVFSTSNGEKRDVRISYYEKIAKDINPDTVNSRVGTGAYGLQLDFNHNGRAYSTRVEFNSEEDKTKNPRLYTVDDYKEQITAEYFASTYTFDDLSRGLKEIVQNKEENVLLKGLRVFDSRVSDIQVYEDEVLLDVGLKRRIPLNMMGDGMRKLFAILVGMYECKNGILLIDEIDNGIHHSVIGGFWRTIVHVARRLNVQVFATTHSKDCLQAFSDAINEKISDVKLYDSASGFVLVKTSEDVLEAHSYSPTQLQYALGEGLEIR